MDDNNTVQSYALALLTLMSSPDRNPGQSDLDDQPLGMALRAETQCSHYNVPAHIFLQAVIHHSLSQESVAQQFMFELAKCRNNAVLNSVNALENDRSISPDHWAAAVHRELSQNGGDISHLTGLATFYLYRLVIPFINPGGKRMTPESTEPPTPNPLRTAETDVLVQTAKSNRRQAALKELIFRRDGDRCLLTGGRFSGPRSLIPRCAHIIPFSIHTQVPVLQAIEMFTGNTVSAENVTSFINHPVNALNLQSDAHDSMNKKLAWGIEARSENNEMKYYIRFVRPEHVAHFILLDDGDEIEFGKGSQGHVIDGPSPEICNLHLGIARVFAGSGFAEEVDRFMRKWDDDEAAGRVDLGAAALRTIFVK
ncbi:hypothetical protein BJV74DRAFT_404162 [Russula compacta]|nr:hypothetical protein BJV74DRAFT_404162 [Russula compacta]